MPSFSSLLALSALLSLARCHGVILNAQGDVEGSPASVGFQVDPAIARNCTTINPCQQDATIIRDAEIKANIVNECGRTELTGNIDVGENTENALAADAVTQVQSGSKITVTIHQVNADGAGPYACDLDETSNSGTISQNLTVTNNVPGSNGFSQAKAQAFNITVQMPDNFTCTGASTGNVCTVRCRNNALAGPFGGCFAVQQVDTTEKTNTPAKINTAQTLGAVLDQVQQNQADFEVSVKANQDAGSDSAEQNKAAVDALLGNTIVSGSFTQETPSVVLGGVPTATDALVTNTVAATTAAATTTDSANSGGNQGNGGNNNNNNNNGDGNGNGNGNGNGSGRNRNGNANGNGQNNRFRGAAKRDLKQGIGGLRWARRLVEAESLS
ncbi:Fc.00g096140.m01.CDS01 [Cosmosporella sp. VM-42]